MLFLFMVVFLEMFPAQLQTGGRGAHPSSPLRLTYFRAANGISWGEGGGWSGIAAPLPTHTVQPKQETKLRACNSQVPAFSSSISYDCVATVAEGTLKNVRPAQFSGGKE